MSLSRDQRILCRVAAALAAGDSERLDSALSEAGRWVDPIAVEEVLIQSYLFLGYPSALNGLGRWRASTGQAAPERGAENEEDWERRGEEVCAAVYGGQYERLRANVRALHPDMERWMLVEGYGKVLGRPGLDLITRELAVVAQLAVIGAPRQLYSHARGALNVGASASQVEAALALASDFAGLERGIEARAVWEELRQRNSPKSPSE